MEEPIFERMAILGLGLIGGSFALAACERGLTKTLVAYDPNVQHLAEASEAGIIEQGFSNARDAVDGADAVMFGSTTMALTGRMRQAAGGLPLFMPGLVALRVMEHLWRDGLWPR